MNFASTCSECCAARHRARPLAVRRDIADGRRALSQAPLALSREAFVEALDGATADDADLAWAAEG